MDPFQLMLQLGLIVLPIVLYVRHKYSYWAKLGVPGPKPSLLSLGNVLQFATETRPPENEPKLVQKYGTVYGTYEFLEPILSVADASVIKRIMVKDFHLFVNRRKVRAYHQYVTANQFATESDKWKRLRQLTSPSFTSSKLKSMHGLMDVCVNNLVKHLDQVTSTGNGLIKTKEVITGFTLDVIASTSFATDINFNNDRNSATNPLVYWAMRLARIPWYQFVSYLVMPAWFNNLAKTQHLFNYNTIGYFGNLTNQVMEQRKKSGERRNDFVQLLMDASAYDSELNGTNYAKLEATENHDQEVKESKPIGQKITFTDNEIIGQSILFFSAGFETTASALTHAIFELSLQTDLQDRLYGELQSTLNRLEETSQEYYDKLMNDIPYLDAVIKETLRKYPPLARLERRYNGPDGEYKIGDISLKKEQLVEISVYGVHYNPKYYPDPERFDPDRFMPQNKDRLVPYAHLPFGLGPRNCVGMRFALQEIKLCLAKVIHQFRFEALPNQRTTLNFDKFQFIATTEGFTTRVSAR